FLTWVESLAAEGEYIQTPGEDLGFEGAFDTVVTYNVLDHVREPEGILRNAARALRPGGQLLAGVDCLSGIGRWRFELLPRRLHRGTILVEAHPHTFLPSAVARMIEGAGFHLNSIAGVPGLLRRVAGSHSRPAFLATRA